MGGTSEARATGQPGAVIAPTPLCRRRSAPYTLAKTWASLTDPNLPRPSRLVLAGMSRLPAGLAFCLRGAVIRTAMHIGVIGAGGMGSRHVENLRSVGGVDVTVFDVDLDRATEVAGRRSLVADDPFHLIADHSIDGIVVASPDDTHAELALACIEAGKPVLVEKPLAETIEDAERVLTVEASIGRRFVQVGFMREFDPEHEALRAEVASGAVGRTILVRCTHANPGFGVPIADALIRSAVHDLHTLRFMTNQEIREVMVHTLPAEEGDRLIRLATITCRLDSALGNITLNMAAGYGYDVQVEVTGERAAWWGRRNQGTPALRKGGKDRVVPGPLARPIPGCIHERDRNVDRVALRPRGSGPLGLGWLRHGGCSQRLHRVRPDPPADSGEPHPSTDRGLVGLRLPASALSLPISGTAAGVSSSARSASRRQPRRRTPTRDPEREMQNDELGRSRIEDRVDTVDGLFRSVAVEENPGDIVPVARFNPGHQL